MYLATWDGEETPLWLEKNKQRVFTDAAAVSGTQWGAGQISSSALGLWCLQALSQCLLLLCTQTGAEGTLSSPWVHTSVHPERGRL